ncbi:MAG TPA: GNAT family N-acetyltransferase [Polyangiaceae bacterium]|nr:GNAT family N-acetyltransferase [Polyangiaceae bacterium]
MPDPEREDIVIRRAVARDLPRVAELAGELVRMHHEADPSRFFLIDDVERGYAWWLSRELARDGAVVLVACRGDAVVGYAYGTLEDRDWNLLLDDYGAVRDVFVSEGERRTGVGRGLVEAVVAALEALGAPRIVLSTMIANEPAQRLFRRCGFRATMLEMTRDADGGGQARPRRREGS